MGIGEEFDGAHHGRRRCCRRRRSGRWRRYGAECAYLTVFGEQPLFHSHVGRSRRRGQELNEFEELEVQVLFNLFANSTEEVNAWFEQIRKHPGGAQQRSELKGHRQRNVEGVMAANWGSRAKWEVRQRAVQAEVVEEEASWRRQTTKRNLEGRSNRQWREGLQWRLPPPIVDAPLLSPSRDPLHNASIHRPSPKSKANRFPRVTALARTGARQVRQGRWRYS